jgi:hypothetical protein
LIATDNLNPIIFSLTANDLFVGFTKFKYNGSYYYKDRAYTFEDQLNQITNRMMDKPIAAYDSANSQQDSNDDPSPTIVNDGRKLYIAARPVSRRIMISPALPLQLSKLSGVDFISLFAIKTDRILDFFLRCGVSYILHNPQYVAPSDPALQIMDRHP